MPEMKLKRGWKVWRFDQLAVKANDRIENPSDADVDRYVGLEHLDPDSLKIRRWGFPSDVKATKLLFRSGDIIFGRRRVYQRKLAVADFPGICSAHAMVLRARQEVVFPEFLPFFMQSDTFMDRALEISVGSLSPTINWKTLAQEVFALPPLEEQRRIVDVLTKTRTVSDLYTEATDRILFARRAAQNELLFEVPHNTSIQQWHLEDIAHINPKDPPLDTTAPFAPMDAVDEWERGIQRFEERGTRGGVRAMAGDVLMARITPCLENGKIAQVPDHISRCGGSTEFIVFRAREGVDRSYLYWLLTSDRIRNTAIAMMYGTTARQRVSGGQLAEVLIPRIPSNKLAKLGNLIDSINASRQELRNREIKAKQFHMRFINYIFQEGKQ